MREVAVAASGLIKKFGNFTAVDNISFEVKKGSIYGFLGANGAGKSTTIRILCGLLEPTSGSAKVAGFDVGKEPESVKKVIGYMSQKFSLYLNLTVSENLTFYAGMYGLPNSRISGRMKEVCAMCELLEFQNRIVTVLPAGIRQRVALAAALMHQPKILFLDEPTGGVDPVLRRKFWNIIASLSASGTTVFVTTHYMDEVEYCHSLALMARGKIIKQGTLDEIRKTAFKGPVVRIDTEDAVHAYDLLKKIKDVSVSMHGASLHIGLPNRERKPVKLIRDILDKKRVPHGAPHDIEPSIEDIFVDLVRKAETEE